MTDRSLEIHKLVAAMLKDRLSEEFVDKDRSLDKAACIEIYQKIFLTVQEIVILVPALKAHMTDVGVNYVSQAYYDMVTINGREEALDPNIFDKRPKTSDMSTKELAHCALFLRGTPVAAEIVAAIKKRN
jgi:hypothetical protein